MVSPSVDQPVPENDAAPNGSRSEQTEPSVRESTACEQETCASADGESPVSKSLPGPEARPGSDVVIYDGQCRFCQAGVKSLSRFDVGGRLSYLSLHSEKVQDLVPQLSYDDLMQEMVVVQPDGTWHGGADAVRYLSRRLPLLWWTAPLLHLPGTARGWRWLYRQVARRRYQLAGKQCDSGTCELHARH